MLDYSVDNSIAQRFRITVLWNTDVFQRVIEAVETLMPAIAFRMAGKDVKLLKTSEPLTPLALNSHLGFPMAMQTL